MKRPTSLTVICWILFVINGLALVSVAFTFRMMNQPEVRAVLEASPIPIPVQLALGIIGPLIVLGSAWMMFKGIAKGRIVYVGWNIFGLSLGLATSPMKLMMIPGIVVFLIFAAFLYRPKVTEYLTSANA